MVENDKLLHDATGGPESSDRGALPPDIGAGAAAARRWLADHGDVLWRFALARTRSTESAEEVLQETFAAAMKAYGGFGGRSSERTWLLGIAAHKATDLQRRAARAARRTEPPAVGAASESTDEFTTRGRWMRIPARVGQLSPDEREELARALQRCLDALPAGQSELIWLREVMAVSSEDLSKLAGVTPTNLWVRLHRARTSLRRCLELAGRAPGNRRAAAKENDR